MTASHQSDPPPPPLLLRAGLFFAGAGALSFAKVMLDKEKDADLRAEMAARRERRRKAAEAEAALTATTPASEA